jgi:16S rRNA (cytosine1402-N4)-methyltransferase
MKYLVTTKEGIYVDATIGRGGHTREILKRCGEGCRVIGIDRDASALDTLREELKDRRLELIHGRFSEMVTLLEERGIEKVDGVLMDLGVSLEQLKTEERGFSFSADAPLDMRMDRKDTLTAFEIVNSWNQRRLEEILKKYGEERKASSIARAIVTQRQRSPIRTCRELASIIERLYRQRGRIHPATRTFQALRIVVNDEIRELEKGLEAALKVLKQGGRLCVISYHSIEDRTVKNFMLSMERGGILKRITRKPLRPTPLEMRENPSSRSAKLRVGERL